MAEATNTILGEIKLTGDLAGDGGAQVGSNPQLTKQVGIIPGQYNVSNITVDTKGRITNISASTSSQINALIPDASTTAKGKIRVGSNLYINGTPTAGYQILDFGGVLLTSTPTGLCPTATYTLAISIDQNPRTFSSLGASLSTIQDVLNVLNSQLGSYLTASLDAGNIKLTSNTTGVVSLVSITTDGLFACMGGFIAILTNVDGMGACELYAKTASAVDAGVAQIGSGINVTDGTISVNLNAMPLATTTTTGVVIVPTAGRLAVDGSGNISVPLATDTVPGVIKSGAGLVIDGNGTLGIDTTTIKATTTTLGTVMVPTAGRLAVDGSGNISVPLATGSVPGVVKSGAGLSVDGAGVLSAPIASAGTLGVVKIGSGLTIDGAGVLTNPSAAIPDATYTSKGVVQINSAYLTVTGGVLSVNQASNSVIGVLKVATSSYLSITAGVLSLTSLVAKKDTAQTYTKAQVVATSALSGSSVTPNLSTSNMFNWTLTANSTLNNGTSNVAGGTYLFTIKQDATGGRTLSFGTMYKFPGGTPTLSTVANKIDIMSCVSDGTNLYCTLNKGF